jgi:hypothetical protein
MNCTNLNQSQSDEVAQPQLLGSAAMTRFGDEHYLFERGIEDWDKRGNQGAAKNVRLVGDDREGVGRQL